MTSKIYKTVKAFLAGILIRSWYCRSLWLLLLWPFSLIIYAIVVVRRCLYQWKFLPSQSFPVPVIVVGNIHVGGTGKTPMVLWLAELLRSKGYKPGIVSRGYSGKAKSYPCHVTADSSVREVGDEAKMLAELAKCPMVIAPNRIAAVSELLQSYDCDVVISDDGLQHYALQRDLELVLLGAEQSLGNGFLLPAGPLREPRSRLKSCDFIIANGKSLPGEYEVRMQPLAVYQLTDPNITKPLSDLKELTIHAVAGIANPDRFFNFLRQEGLVFFEHPFEDHYRFEREDLQFSREGVILMTEKDAVKCREFADDKYWVLPVRALLEPGFEAAFLKALEKVAQLKGNN